MEFKIDTKDTFTIIVPLNGAIDANLTGEVTKKCAELAQDGVKNFVVDLAQAGQVDRSAVGGLVALHESCYENDRSIVYTGIDKQGIALLKEFEADLLLNVAPTMKEAIDIISMEILERDLFKEE